MAESRYTYPGTDVLINLPGIRDQDELTRFETIVTKERLAQLVLQPIQGNFDLKHLQEIHRFIFQDVYPFAGQIRLENIAKDTFRFAQATFIESSASQLFQELRNENYLKGTSKDQFADRAAYYMAELNVLHPFREGNGRTQREFIRQLASQAGYELDWSRVSKEKIFEASVRSVSNTKELAEVIRYCLDDNSRILLKDLLKQTEGVPTKGQTFFPDRTSLNREVAKYQITKKGNIEIIEFRFAGENQSHSLQMEKIPHLTKEKRDFLIEQAAQGKSISLFRDLSR